MFIYWVIIPVGIIVASLWLFTKSTTRIQKAGFIILGVISFIGYSWLLFGERWMLDNKVDVLCEKDGGVKVYEKIILSPEKFNEWGVVNFYHPSQEKNALGNDYIFEQNIHYFKKGSLSLYRYHVKVIYRKNEKTLAESIGYYRNGGNRPGPWNNTSHSCSMPNGEIPLLKSLFVKSKG